MVRNFSAPMAARTLEVDHMVVAVVTYLNLLEAKLVQDPVPGLLSDDGRGIHDSPVCRQ